MHNLLIQAYAATSKYHGFKVSQRSRLKYTLKGTVLSRKTSILYHLRIILKKNKRPDVFIDEPKMDLKEHVYHDQSLCIYYPADEDYFDGLFIRKVLIPAIPWWIFCYENWRLTGIWIGDEAPHSIHAED